MPWTFSRIIGVGYQLPKVYVRHRAGRGLCSLWATRSSPGPVFSAPSSPPSVSACLFLLSHFQIEKIGIVRHIYTYVPRIRLTDTDSRLSLLWGEKWIHFELLHNFSGTSVSIESVRHCITFLVLSLLVPGTLGLLRMRIESYPSLWLCLLFQNTKVWTNCSNQVSIKLLANGHDYAQCLLGVFVHFPFNFFRDRKQCHSLELHVT